MNLIQLFLREGGVHAGYTVCRSPQALEWREKQRESEMLVYQRGSGTGESQLMFVQRLLPFWKMWLHSILQFWVSSWSTSPPVGWVTPWRIMEESPHSGGLYSLDIQRRGRKSTEVRDERAPFIKRISRWRCRKGHICICLSPVFRQNECADSCKRRR